MPPRKPPRRGAGDGAGRSKPPAGGRPPRPGKPAGLRRDATGSAAPGRRPGKPAGLRGDATGSAAPGRRPGKPAGLRRDATGSAAPGRRPGDRRDTAREGRPARTPNERTKSWGGVAKRGVGKLKPTEKGTASAAWREAAKESDSRERGRMGGAAPAWEREEWVDAGPVRDEARRAVDRGAAKPVRPRRSRELPDEVKGEVARHAGPAWAGRVNDRLNEAAQAFERERYRDALKLLKPLSERAPGSPAIRELLGLTLYRLGRWREAIKELETAELLSGSVDHHPVIADAHRALGRHDDVRRLWDELRKGGAGVDVLIEGRIVLAGSLADQGKVRDAIELLEQGPVNVRKPKEHHLRLWYALAATYEKAGDLPRARGLFRRVAEAAPDFADAYERYDALG